MPDEVLDPTKNPEPESEARPTGFSQQDVDRIVQDRLAREREKFADYDELKTAATTIPTLTQERDDAAARAQKSEEDALRLHVTFAKGLPLEVAQRLQGKTQEELETDADALAAIVRPINAGPDLGGGARTEATTPLDMNALIRRSAGRAG